MCPVTDMMMTTTTLQLRRFIVVVVAAVLLSSLDRLPLSLPLLLLLLLLLVLVMRRRLAEPGRQSRDAVTKATETPAGVVDVITGHAARGSV